MTAQQARQLIHREGQRHTLIIYGRKTDGTPRRFVCRYYGASSARANQMVVWDVEKGRPSTVCLDRIDEITVCGRKAERAGDRDPVPPQGATQSFEDLQREMQELFY